MDKNTEHWPEVGEFITVNSGAYFADRGLIEGLVVSPVKIGHDGGAWMDIQESPLDGAITRLYLCPGEFKIN